MTIEQKRAAEPVEQQRELRLDCLVIGAVGLVEPLVELLGRDRPAPQKPMLRGARGNDPKSAARARADSGAPGTFDHRRIDLILAAVAVDRCARGSRDHRAAAALEGAPHQAVDERIFKRGQRRLPRGGKANQPVRVVTARVRHRQQYRELAARPMDRGWGKFVHGCG